jgi:hypothetical protein
MKRAQQLVAVVLTALVLSSTTVAAQEPAAIVRSHNPRLAATAALLNIGYVPLRMMVTLVDGLLGGFVGFITFGDKSAADSIWALTSGPQVITPEMLEGTERWHMGAYD